MLSTLSWRGNLYPPALPTLVGSLSRSTPIKRSSSAQAPTRAKLRAVAPLTAPPRGTHHDRHPPSSPARPTRRPHSDLYQTILEEGDPDRDSIHRSGPYASLDPHTSPWDRRGRDMIGVHTPSGTVISPILSSLLSDTNGSTRPTHNGHGQRPLTITSSNS